MDANAQQQTERDGKCLLLNEPLGAEEAKAKRPLYDGKNHLDLLLVIIVIINEILWSQTQRNIHLDHNWSLINP